MANVELGDKWITNVEKPVMSITEGGDLTRKFPVAIDVDVSEDFLSCRELPDPSSLSNIAREMLKINQKALELRRSVSEF